MLEFYTGNPDVSPPNIYLTPQERTRKEQYAATRQMWDSAGIVIRGVLTQAITKSEGPFADGDKPGEDDCEWPTASSLIHSPHHYVARAHGDECGRRPRDAGGRGAAQAPGQDGRAQL